MRMFSAAALVGLLAGPAFGQGQAPVPRYGDLKDKSPQEIAAERETEKAYKKSLGNIPERGPADPWGNVRSDNPPKPAAKAVAKDATAKRAKTGGAN